MKSLTQYSEQQGKKPTGQFAATRYILDNPEAKAIFLKVAEEAEKEYLSEFNLADKMEEVIRFKTNDQLNQFSSMYFNKVKKDLIIYGL